MKRRQKEGEGEESGDRERPITLGSLGASKTLNGHRTLICVCVCKQIVN